VVEQHEPLDEAGEVLRSEEDLQEGVATRLVGLDEAFFHLLSTVVVGLLVLVQSAAELVQLSVYVL
jgi:hypothetical protein